MRKNTMKRFLAGLLSVVLVGSNVSVLWAEDLEVLDSPIELADGGIQDVNSTYNSDIINDDFSDSAQNATDEILDESTVDEEIILPDYSEELELIDENIDESFLSEEELEEGNLNPEEIFEEVTDESSETIIDDSDVFEDGVIPENVGNVLEDDEPEFVLWEEDE